MGPLHPWRGGLAQYLQLLGEALMLHAEVRGVTFTRQYPGVFFPGTSQLDPAAPLPKFPTESLLDSIGFFSWRRTAVHLERFAPGAVVLKWWMPFFAPAFASAVGPLRRKGTKVILVCDNLSTHTKGAFYETFEPARARDLVRRIAFCHTPKHGSWLNIAENELSSLTRQCVSGRRFGDTDTLRHETTAWSSDVNATQRGVDWQLKIDDARCKLKSVYPKIKL